MYAATTRSELDRVTADLPDVIPASPLSERRWVVGTLSGARQSGRWRPARPTHAVAVLGGIGNLYGAVLGALIIGMIQAFNEGLNWHAPGSDWTEAIVFSILILILVFRPEGLLGERTPEGG